MYMDSDGESDEEINFDWLSNGEDDICLRSNCLTQDFEKLVQRDAKSRAFAFSSVGPEILHLISDSDHGDGFPEAKSCIDALRHHSIQQSRYTEFNSVAQVIVAAALGESSHDTRAPSFRRFLKESGVSLMLVSTEDVSVTDSGEAATQSDQRELSENISKALTKIPRDEELRKKRKRSTSP